MVTNLFNAIRNSDLLAFHALLEEDPLILERVSLNSMENPLHISSLAGQIEMTREITSRKPAFMMELNQDGFSPLHIASSGGHVEVVKEILKARGDDVCALKGKDGKTPLHCAAMKGRVDVIKELISACPHCIGMVNVCGETALHVSAKSNQFESFKILMEELKRLDVIETANWKDKDGNTVLHLTSLRKQQEIVELLIGKDGIAYGIVDVNAINSSGLTPKDALDIILQIRPEHSDFHVLEMFQQAGAMKAKEITESSAASVTEESNLNQNSTPPAASKSLTWNLWKVLKMEIEKSSIDTQNALMVVAVLIASVTYQAVLSPPSGFWSADTKRGYQTLINSIERRTALPGEAVMSGDPYVFTLFTVLNTVGFLASLTMISMLTSGFPLRAGLRLAILSMAATYVIAVAYIGPTDLKAVLIVVLLMAFIVLIEFARFTIWLLKKLGILPFRTAIRRSTSVADQSSRV